MKTVIGSIQEFMKDCPALPKFYKAIGIDHLKDEVDFFMVEQIPGKPVVKSYINGDAVKQCIFVFASTEPYGSDVRQALDTHGFYEAFDRWISECNASGHLPDLEGDREAREIEVNTPGYLYDARVEKAQYRVQCKLIYFEKGN